MLQTYVRIDKSGKVISSGANEKVSVKQFKHTACVNDGDELSIGSVCANAVEITFLDIERKLDLTAGDEIWVARGENGDEIGRFIVEQPTRPTANTMKITGYNLVTKLDKDLTGWLNGLTGWPYSVETFAPMVAAQCGLRFAANWETTPNAGYMIPKFSYTGVTGRMLMRWLGEICARFCYADGDILRFGWYKSSGVTIQPTGDRYYFEGGLTFEDYKTAKIEAVQLQLADSDSGALWPEKPEGTNSYVIRNNAILQTRITQETEECLTAIANAIKDDTYTPCKVVIPACLDIAAGNTVNIVDKNGKSITAYVMTKVTEGQKDTIECTGSARRDSAKNLNNQRPASQTDAAKLAQEAAQKAVDSQTQEDIFNKLTNNGELQGFFFQDGRWYFNGQEVHVYNLLANAIVSGLLKSVDGKTYFDLDSGEIVADAGDHKVSIKNGTIKVIDSNGKQRITINRVIADGVDAYRLSISNASGNDVFAIQTDAFDGALLSLQNGTYAPKWKTVDGTTYLVGE